MKMEERQLIKLAGWFRTRHVSCLRVLAGGLAYLPDRIPIKFTIYLPLSREDFHYSKIFLSSEIKNQL